MGARAKHRELSPLEKLQTIAETLEPFARLHANKDFQAWLAGLTTEVDSLRNVMWNMPWPLGTTDHWKAIRSCGLPAPRNERDLLLTFLTLRGVVTFLRGKLDELARNVKRFEQVREAILEEQNARRTPTLRNSRSGS